MKKKKVFWLLCVLAILIPLNVHAQNFFLANLASWGKWSNGYFSPFSGGLYHSPFSGGIGLGSGGGGTGGGSTAVYITPVLGLQVIEFIDEPRIGAHAVGAIGLDTQYVFRSGFTIWFNNVIGVGPYDASTSADFPDIYIDPDFHTIIMYTADALLGYTIRVSNHLIGFGGGAKVGGMPDFVFVKALGIRIDYAYMFSDKIGVQVSLNEGIGDSEVGLTNIFALKLGCVFRVK